MDCFIIAAGGTGAICARAFVYLAAAGYTNKEKVDTNTYHILLMDKDKRSDAVTACENLLSDYNALREQMGAVDGSRTFPKIKIHNWNFTSEIVDEYEKQSGFPGANLNTLTLEKLLNPNLDPTIDRILSTMYTKEERNTDLEKGFYGHPNIGAPVFDYVKQRFQAQQVVMANGSTKDNTFMQDLHNALSAGKAYVYLMGSLFGGTGATVIPNLVLALRELKDDNGNEYGKTNLVLGGSMIMPYFKLPTCPVDSLETKARVTPVDAKFEGQTRDALAYYHESGLLDNMMNLLLLGSSKLDVTSEIFARGGVQSQHFHLVNLLSAVAAKRFFADELGSMKNATNVPNGTPVIPAKELLVWKASPDDNGVNPSLTADELGIAEEFNTLNSFLRFSVVVGYYMRLRFESDPQGMRHWNEIEGTCKQFDLEPKKLTKEDVEEKYKNNVKKAGAICKGFLQFLYDVSLTGYDWSGYHAKEKVLDNNTGLFAYSVTDRVETGAAAAFGNRWVDFANLQHLKDLVEATSISGVLDNLSMKNLCSFKPMGGQAQVTGGGTDTHIATVYNEALAELGLERKLFGKLRRDDVHFCQIYDKINGKV